MGPMQGAEGASQGSHFIVNSNHSLYPYQLPRKVKKEGSRSMKKSRDGPTALMGHSHEIILVSTKTADSLMKRRATHVDQQGPNDDDTC